MLLFPAIDLMDGCAVRLQKGDPEAKTVYSNDPPAFARKWEEAGGDWLHIVDLDAAFSGRSTNLETVAAICASVRIPCELGGGMRDIGSVRAALDAGVSRVVIGTRAAEAPDFVAELVREFGGERIAVGIDARDGFVATKGWKTTTTLRAGDFAEQIEGLGVRHIIFTDIATDGMLRGPNLPALESMCSATSMNVIASGGISCREDLVRIEATGRVHGAIIGKALYDGLITGPLRPLAGANPAG